MTTLTSRPRLTGAPAASPTERELYHVLEPIAREYPHMVNWLSTMDPAEPNMLQRTAFDMSLVVDRKGTDITVVDIGAGGGLWNLGFAALGARSIFVDAFFSNPYREDFLRLFEKYGVEVIERDVIKDGLQLPPASLDVAANFHFMEHLHHSPKQLFHAVAAAIKPDGLFVLAGPNCVNLRKRISGIAGRCKWSPMDQWYESDTFYGHVREPDVDDLRYIATDIGFNSFEIYGRNFLGLSHTGWKQKFARASDRLLRQRPALCSDIYLVAARSA